MIPEHFSVAIENTRIQLDSIEDLLTDIRHELIRIQSVVRKRAESLIEEIIACSECAAVSPEDSLAAVLQEGWANLRRDDGDTWNYLGLCPRCQEEAIFDKPVPVLPTEPTPPAPSVPETPREVKRTLF